MTPEESKRIQDGMADEERTVFESNKEQVRGWVEGAMAHNATVELVSIMRITSRPGDKWEEQEPTGQRYMLFRWSVNELAEPSDADIISNLVWALQSGNDQYLEAVERGDITGWELAEDQDVA